uniref:Uncharacterized protein n=1 Tax=Chrysotila carterae TaxID=13221 RepID=A0A7S4F742_CHRCT
MESCRHLAASGVSAASAVLATVSPADGCPLHAADCVRDAQAMLGGTIRFVGVVGDGYLSDMAIDDIGFVECLPPPPPPPPPPFPPVGVRWAACQDFCSALNADSHCDDDKCSMCPFCVATSVDGPSADSARTPCCSWDKCGTCPPTGYCTSRNKCELECHGHWCHELSGIPL